jgi:hypothetical protein
MKIDRTTLAVMLAAGVFMVWGADYYTVFDDEAFSLQRYVLPAGEIVAGLWRGVEPDPPLYYVLEHAWIRVFGVRPLPLRGLSIALFLLSLPVIRAAGETWFDARAGRWAVVMCGLNPLHLFFGFAARWYSLLFLCTATMILAAGRLVGPANGRSSRTWISVWLVAAIAACYTNYLGLLIAGLMWSWGLATGRGGRRRWNRMFGAVLLAFSPWAPAFVNELRRMPQAANEGFEYVACAGRTVVALLAGNLADHRTWYVWVMLGGFAAATMALAVANRRWLTLPAVVAGGVFVAGVASLTMIDKYVMAFSGAFWLTVAAVLAGEYAGWRRYVRGVAVGALCFAWAGCGINWILEQGWTSLRWLDPIPDVVRKHIDDSVIVATHPSVRYYYGCMDRARWTGRLEPDAWAGRADLILTPAQALERLEAAPTESPSGRPFVVTTIQTASIRSDDGAWPALEAWLNENMEMQSLERIMSDPLAELKDRMDERYVHPVYRVVAKTFAQLKESRNSR